MPSIQLRNIQIRRYYAEVNKQTSTVGSFRHSNGDPYVARLQSGGWSPTIQRYQELHHGRSFPAWSLVCGDIFSGRNTYGKRNRDVVVSCYRNTLYLVLPVLV